TGIVGAGERHVLRHVVAPALRRGGGGRRHEFGGGLGGERRTERSRRCLAARAAHPDDGDQVPGGVGEVRAGNEHHRGRWRIVAQRARGQTVSGAEQEVRGLHAGGIEAGVERDGDFRAGEHARRVIWRIYLCHRQLGGGRQRAVRRRRGQVRAARGERAGNENRPDQATDVHYVSPEQGLVENVLGAAGRV